MREVLESQLAEGRAMLEREGAVFEHVEALHEADLQFQGQSHLLTIPVASPAVTRTELQAAFEAAYWHRFHVRLPEIRAVLVNVHTAVLGVRKTLPLDALGRGDPAATLAEARTGTRAVWFEGGWQDTPIYRRDRLPVGACFTGPAIVDQLDTTIVLEPGFEARRDALGNLVLTLL
jgi:N-methylhydantoinase A